MADITGYMKLEDYKILVGLEKLDVYISKSGKKYTLVNQEPIMLTPDIDTTSEMWIIFMSDSETCEKWKFITSDIYSKKYRDFFKPDIQPESHKEKVSPSSYEKGKQLEVSLININGINLGIRKVGFIIFYRDNFYKIGVDYHNEYPTNPDHFLEMDYHKEENVFKTKNQFIIGTIV